MQNVGEKFVIVRNEKIVNFGLFDSYEETYEYIKDSIFSDDIDKFTIVTFKDYVSEVRF